MTTTSEFRKALRAQMGSFFAEHGFVETKKNPSYFRSYGDGVIQIISIHPTRGCISARINVICTVPEIFDLAGTGESLDGPLVIYVGGGLGDDGVGSHLYDLIETETQLNDFFQKAKDLIVKHAFPFFGSISDRQKFWDACDKNTQRDFSRKKMKDAILNGKKL